MPWWQFSVTCQSSELEQVESLLLDLGALSLSLADAGDEPLYEPLPGDNPIWQDSVVTGMFDPGVDHEALYQRLMSALPPHLLDLVRQQSLQEQDWEEAYKLHFKPIQCSRNLWIVPSWCDPPDPDATNIRLDPGMAFGTGGHATTALCLNWLGEHDISGYSVIDYGCGSGILAIAACQLGAEVVDAIDIDPQALRASEANAQTNGIDSARIIISLPDGLQSKQVDLLMANILSGPLISFAARFAGLIKPGGQILLSGILKTQLEEIQLAYQPWFEFDPVAIREDWARVSGTRKHV